MIAVCFISCKTEKENTKPNIIFILADDLGYGDLSCFGSTEIETPSLDKLAGGGMKLTQFYAGAPICTPTRAAFQTGLFPVRFGIKNAFMDVKGQYLPDTTQSIAELLKEAGYFTAHIGKWHLGGIREEDFTNRNNGGEADPGPMQHGYDYYLSNIEEKAHRGVFYHADCLYHEAGKHLVRNDQKAESIDDHWTKIKADEVIQLLEERRDQDQPFFLNLCFFVPHVPYEPVPDQEIMNKYRDKGASGYDLLYRSMVSYMDAQIGRILDKLDDLGMAENTLVIFTSDNGPYVEGSSGHFQGRKTDVHEGGIREPAIARWPAKIKPGTVSDAPIHIVDMLPTFCEIAGISTDNIPLDGQSILPQLTQGKSLEDRKPMFWDIVVLNNFPSPVPHITDTLYKGSTRIREYLNNEDRPRPIASEAYREGNWKMMTFKNEPVALYNLKIDPKEQHNLIDEHPEIIERMMKGFNEIITSPRFDYWQEKNN